MSIEELKRDLKDKKPVIGADRTIKNLKSGTVEKIYLASNVKDEIRKDVLHYAKLANVKVIQLEEDNFHVKFVCKKPFNISVISF